MKAIVASLEECDAGHKVNRDGWAAAEGGCDGVDTSSAPDQVVATIQNNEICLFAATNLVIAGAAEKLVVSRPADDQIATLAADEKIGAPLTEDPVMAPPPPATALHIDIVDATKRRGGGRAWFGDWAWRRYGCSPGRRVLAENLDAELDALVADVSRLSGDQLFTCHCHLPQNQHLQSGGKWESTNHEEYRVDRPMLAPLRLARRVHAAQPPAVTLSTSCCHARHFGGGFQRPGLDRGAEPKNRVSLCSMSDRDVAG